LSRKFAEGVAIPRLSVRLSDIEPRFVCQACGKRGADVRPNFHWQGAPVGGMGYRKSFGGEANTEGAAT
jgi:hypothetical protein